MVKPNYYVQIQHQGRRLRFHLQTPNKAAAAARARGIYKDLLEGGWEAVQAKLDSPNISNETSVPATDGSPTVGDLLGVIESISTARPATLETYFKALRKIAADIEGVEQGDKYDARHGGNAAWKAKVDAIKLNALTPERVIEWKVAFLKGSDPAHLRSAKTTVNSLIRNAKALFAKKHMKYLASRLELPSPLPFDDVPMEKQPSMRYQSKVDAESILRDAETELGIDSPESYKILLLGLMCGLRRSEIDTLLWSAFDFENSKLLVAPNEFNELKSEDSAGDIDLDADLNQLFWKFYQKAKGNFVVESATPPAHRNVTRAYRAEKHFKYLNTWLREKGLDVRKPLHELRKEFGALITERYGIYAASRALRHSHIAITVAHYADKKEKVTVGLKALFQPTDGTAPSHDGNR
ncbi:MAG: tyrosine-type recombinase/integrase [Verrucomicrobiales bacterium]